MVGKIYLESMMYESGFSAVTEMGVFALKNLRSILGTRFFWISIFTSSASVGESSKQSVSTTSIHSGSLNTNPPTLMLLLLQSIQIQFYASLNACVQYQQEGGRGLNRG